MVIRSMCLPGSTSALLGVKALSLAKQCWRGRGPGGSVQYTSPWKAVRSSNLSETLVVGWEHRVALIKETLPLGVQAQGAGDPNFRMGPFHRPSAALGQEAGPWMSLSIPRRLHAEAPNPLVGRLGNHTARTRRIVGLAPAAARTGPALCGRSFLVPSPWYAPDGEGVGGLYESPQNSRNHRARF